VQKPKLAKFETSRTMMKANLILAKTIPKNYEHVDEIRYLDEVNNEVKYHII
jgi:hypothetical protein